MAASQYDVIPPPAFACGARCSRCSVGGFMWTEMALDESQIH